MREDRNAEAQKTFEPLTIEIKYPDTAILLLRSPEKPILMAAAAALSKFGEKAKGNLEALFDLNVVENVLALVEHEDLFTRRFALKLLAIMSAVQNVQTHLLKTDFYITFFTKMLSNESDTFLQEFSSRILAELSSDPSGAALFLEKISDVSFLFQKLQSNDPDIKKNCIEILDNLLMDLNGFTIVSCSKNFSFAAIYELFDQPYSVIQLLALSVIEHLLVYNTENGIHEKFRSSGGVQSLLEILNHDDWTDLFCQVLHILSLSCNNSKTAEYINKTDAMRQLFSFMENTKDDKLKFGALNALIRLAGNMNGKKLLHSHGLVECMLVYLEAYKEPDVHALICEGIGKMIHYGPAADEIIETNPVHYILKLLNNNEAMSYERQAAAFALKELFVSNLQNCINFLEINGHADLIRLIQQPGKGLSLETQVTIIQTITAIADYPSLAIDLIDVNLFCALCSILESESCTADELKIASCNALARFPINEEARKVLVQVNALKKLYYSITDAASVPVRNAAAQLVLLLCADPFLANLCTQQGYLIYMLRNRSASRVISTWDSCIQALFSADLPMKFAYTGRLSLHDITTDGFYVLRRSSCPFPVLEELFRLKVCPLDLIYVVNFGKPKNPGQDLYCESKQIAFEAAKEDLKRESLKSGIRVSEAMINAWLELKFGRLQVDYDLTTYLEVFKAELEVAEEVTEENDTCEGSVPGLIEMSKIASRARRLGEFVARQMSGSDPSNRGCIDQQLELHLRTIRDSIETSIVPLGLLRVGSSLERSLLFKVMADQIGLPASLVRGRYGRSWVEIAIPVIEISCEDTKSASVSSTETMAKYLPKFQGLSTKYLHENFIVDLTNVPGELIPIESVRGRSYGDTRSSCEFACRK